MTQQKIQAGNHTISNIVKLDFFLKCFSATKIVTWYCCVYDSAESRYKMILGRDLLKPVGIKFKIYQKNH